MPIIKVPDKELGNNDTDTDYDRAPLFVDSAVLAHMGHNQQAVVRLMTQAQSITNPASFDQDGAAQAHARIEIVQWRELFDDEDGLRVEVFAAGDETSPLALIAADEYVGEDDTLIWEWDNPEDVAHPGMLINQHSITDGEVIESHDGRKFLVSIKEVQA